MPKIQIQTMSADKTLPIYAHLEPIVTVLLAHGNLLARSDRWGSTRDGFVCYLQKPIDFELIREKFELPGSVVLAESKDLVACEDSWATIYGDKGKWGIL